MFVLAAWLIGMTTAHCRSEVMVLFSCFQSSSWRLFTAVPWSFLISGSTAQRRPANVSVCVFSQNKHCDPYSKGRVVLVAWSDLLLCLSTFPLASKHYFWTIQLTVSFTCYLAEINAFFFQQVQIKLTKTFTMLQKMSL